MDWGEIIRTLSMGCQECPTEHSQAKDLLGKKDHSSSIIGYKGMEGKKKRKSGGS